MKGETTLPRWVSLGQSLLILVLVALLFQVSIENSPRRADAKVIAGCENPVPIGHGASGLGMTYAYDCADGRTIVTFRPLGEK